MGGVILASQGQVRLNDQHVILAAAGLNLRVFECRNPNPKQKIRPVIPTWKIFKWCSSAWPLVQDQCLLTQAPLLLDLVIQV